MLMCMRRSAEYQISWAKQSVDLVVEFDAPQCCYRVLAGLRVQELPDLVQGLLRRAIRGVGQREHGRVDALCSVQ